MELNKIEKKLSEYILPYPYEAYSAFERNQNRNFEGYRDKIYGWVRKNGSKERVEMYLDMCQRYANKQGREFLKKLREHKDKLLYMTDFSGIAFGILFSERNSDFEFAYPYVNNEYDNVLYPEYNYEEFKSMSSSERLDWLDKHCEFIPVRIMYADILADVNESYLYSLIKRDNDIMGELKDFLEKSKHKPNDNVYYFICSDAKTKKYYLKRDTTRSPKKDN